MRGKVGLHVMRWYDTLYQYNGPYMHNSLRLSDANCKNVPSLFIWNSRLLANVFAIGFCFDFSKKRGAHSVCLCVMDVEAHCSPIRMFICHKSYFEIRMAFFALTFVHIWHFNNSFSVTLRSVFVVCIFFFFMSFFNIWEYLQIYHETGWLK